MLIRYVLLLIVFNIVYSKHVLNKVPVRVPKPVKINKGSLNKVDGFHAKNKLDVLDDNGPSVPKDEKEQLKEPGAGDESPAGNKDDDGNTEKIDRAGDDGEKEVPVPKDNNDETETVPPLGDENQEDGDNEKQPAGDGEKKVSAENVDGNAGDGENTVPAEDGDGNAGDGEKKVPAEDGDGNAGDGEKKAPAEDGDGNAGDGEKKAPAEDGDGNAGDGEKKAPAENDDGNAGDGEKQAGEEKEAPKANDDDKAADENTKLKKHRKNKYEDNMLDRYHPEKVRFMQDDISASWPLGIIPYHFDTSSFDDILAARIRDAMDLLEHSSCLQFRALSGRKPDNLTWIHITNPWRQRECSHKPKRKSSGEIVLILGLDCLKQRDLLHSLLHGIGFNDEVTHPHRDQYIRIMWENIQPVYLRLFGVIPRHKKLLVEYDPMSIMHFHDRAFSKNGQATISVMMPGLQIQPTDKLSQLDKMRLRLAFGHECNRRTVDKIFDTCKTVLRTNQASEEGSVKLRKVKKVAENP